MQNILSSRLAEVVIGNPSEKTTRMGALASQSQREDVRAKAAILAKECDLIFGDGAFTVNGVDVEKGAFMQPMLFHCSDPMNANNVHDIEAFGPVSTIMPIAILMKR